MGGIYPLSDIRANLIRNSSGNGPINMSWPRASDGLMVGQSAAKAFANWGSDGSTTKRESLNVTSITDVSTGTYTLNFTNDFSNNAFSNSGLCGVGVNSGAYYAMTLFGGAPTAGSVSVRTVQLGTNNSQTGLPWNSLISHGDLA
jgi:hypothetical protein